MAQKIPKTMKALITQSNETAKVEEVPVPEIDDNEVLVKVVALAQNPTDWKRASLSLRQTFSFSNFATQMLRAGAMRARSADATGPVTS